MSTLDNAHDIYSFEGKNEETQRKGYGRTGGNVNLPHIDDIKEIGIDAVDIGVGTESPLRQVTDGSSPAFNISNQREGVRDTQPMGASSPLIETDEKSSPKHTTKVKIQGSNQKVLAIKDIKFDPKSDE